MYIKPMSIIVYDYEYHKPQNLTKHTKLSTSPNKVVWMWKVHMDSDNGNSSMVIRCDSEQFNQSVSND